MAGGQQRLARQHDGRRGRDVADPADDGVLQRGPGPADDRKTRDVDQVARQQIRRLLGFDQRRAGVVPDINPMALFPRPRMHRDVFDEHRLPDPRAGHGPANPHPAIELIHRVMGVEAGDRPHRERPRFRSAGVDDRVGGAPGEQRDAANLPRLVVEGARVTAKPDPGVDEPREILRREIPEPGPHFAAVHRDVDKQRLSRLGHPGPLADADRLDVLAIEDPAQKRRIRDVPGRWQRRPAESSHGVRHDGRRESTPGRVAVDFDDVAGVQLDFRLLAKIRGAVVHEQPGGSVVHDQTGGLAFVDVGDRSANGHPAAPVGTLRRQRADGVDGGHRREPVFPRQQCAGGQDTGADDRQPDQGERAHDMLL